MYEPREDSFLIEKYVKKLVSGNVLDVGTGGGILALAAKVKGCNVLAVDIDKESVEYCKKKGINSFVSDLFENVSGKFDWIVFNPPYLPEDPAEDEESKRIVDCGLRNYRCGM